MDRRDFLSRASSGLVAGLAAVSRPAAIVEARAGETTRKRDLIIAQPADLTSLDPHASTYSSDFRVAFNVFDGLIRRHPDGTLHPALATAWRRTAPTTWQLALRSDVHWHDGIRFTSADAKYSLDRTYDPSVKAARLFGAWAQTIERTEAPDPTTLIVHTRRPDLLLPARLAFCGGQMVFRGRTSTGSASRPSTSGPWAAGRCASGRGVGAIAACSRPMPTTGAAAWTWTGWCSAGCRMPSAAWISSCAATWT